MTRSDTAPNDADGVTPAPPMREVTRTYLELRTLSNLRRGTTPATAPGIERLDRRSFALFRSLYVEVGRAYQWTDRLAWTDEAIRQHLDDPNVGLWLAQWRHEPAGYFELRRHPDRSVEIAYLGLLPNFIGRGWGKALL